jgi:sugar (pentulose or hexulose) kinase
VDYCLLDKDGYLIANPRHYRDSRTRGIFDRIDGRITRRQLFDETGIFSQELNTVCQLASEPIPQNVGKLLFMPDLLGYFLTGEKRCEKTILSTSQLFDVKNGTLSETVLNKLGVSRSLFCPIIEPGTVLGEITREISAETGIPQIPVVAVAGHDTASAVAAVPFDDGVNSMFISCGTWSLLGAEFAEPLITQAAFDAGFTNEIGYGNTIRFLKNIVGLWIAQQCVEKWKREGQGISFAWLDEETAAAQSSNYIDPNDALFIMPPDMTAAITEFCLASGQRTLSSRGEYLACITQSLAMEYRRGIELLENLSGKKTEVLHIAGGGANNKLLCQYTANASGKTVIAGPVEATAAGNLMIQLITLGKISCLRAGREIIKNTFKTQAFSPQDTGKWDSEYLKYLKIIKRGG